MDHINSLFNPCSIAVIGASQTPGKIGHTIVQNILGSGYKGLCVSGQSCSRGYLRPAELQAC